MIRLSRYGAFLNYGVFVTPLVLLVCVRPGLAQTNSARNPVIEKIVAEISPDSIKRNIEKLVGFHTRHTLSDTLSDTRGIGAARRWIKAEMERYSKANGGRMEVSYDESVTPPSQRVNRPTKIVNVVGYLPGAQTQSKDRIYVVSGHYDSRASDPMDSASFAPGANDDGSGTALVLELSRVMNKYQFDASIVFLAVAGEEQGLLGSTHWAQMAKEKNWTIAGVLNNDIVGNIRGGNGAVDSTHVRVFSEGVPLKETEQEARLRLNTGGENDSPSRQVARYAKEIAERYVTNFSVEMIYRRDRYLRGGDHIPFNERGYAAVRFTEMVEDFNHQHQNVREESGTRYGDLPEFVSVRYCSQVAKVNAAVLASLALAPATPSNATIVTSRLEYSTTLRWNANTELDVAGYRILVRKTTSPQWERTIDVGNMTQYTVEDASKDNYLLGVRAYDHDGNESLVAFPRPGR